MLRINYFLEGYLKTIFQNEIAPFSTILIFPYSSLTSIEHGSSIISNTIQAEFKAIFALRKAVIKYPAPKAEVKII